jgi:hypothetical protein
MDDFERFDRWSYVVMFVLAWIPDALIAWAAMKATDGGAGTFWGVLIGIQVVVLLFWVKRALWAWVVWRAWGRDRTIGRTVMLLERSGIPKPDSASLDAETYLEHVKNNSAQPVEARIAAAEAQMAIAVGGLHGVVSAVRTRDAWNAALAKWAVA